MSDTRKKKSGVFVWAIMGFLVLGLGGFGLTGAFQTTGGSTVASVGSEDISADRFLTGLQQDINRTSAQVGQNLTMQQAQLFGVDQSSLRRQVTLAALANEANRLNISVGDLAVRDSLVSNPAFQVAGAFSEAGYDLSLNQQRISRTEYEELIRTDETQSLVSTVVSGAVGPQAAAARTLLDFIAEKRNVTWVEITADNYQGAIETVDEATARTYYTENPEEFTIPETRKLTYVSISPQDLLDDIEVSEEDIQLSFKERESALNSPARRIVDRIIFGSLEEASAAMARIASGEASFSDIAAERGLSEDEVDIGLVRATQLSTAAAELLFSVEENGVYGPVEATLGPAIFNVKAVLAENIVAFDDVKDAIRNELALDQAQSLLLTKIGNIEDLLAGGATLEDLAAETEMKLHTYDLNALSEVENTIDEALYAEGYAAEVGEDRDLVEIGDSEIISLRVDEIVAPRLLPFEEVIEDATLAATRKINIAAAKAYAEELVAQVEAGADLAATIAATDEIASVEIGVTRSAPPLGLSDDVSLALFDIEDGKVASFPSSEGAYIVEINSVTAFDPTSEDGASFLAQVESQIKDDVANDLYIYYASGVVANTEITINQGMIDQILASVAQ